MKALTAVAAAIAILVLTAAVDAKTCVFPTRGYLQAGSYALERTEANQVARLSRIPGPDPTQAIEFDATQPTIVTVTKFVPPSVWERQFAALLGTNSKHFPVDRSSIVEIRTGDGRTGWMPAGSLFSLGDASGPGKCEGPRT